MNIMRQRILSGMFYFLSINTIRCNVFTVDLAVLTSQRLDSIVFPNQSPAGHVHSFVGESKVSKTSEYVELLNSHCTTGNVDADLSAYWVPSLYVKKPSGKFHHVEMNFHVYYKLINDKGQTGYHNNPISPGEFKAFPLPVPHTCRTPSLLAGLRAAGPGGPFLPLSLTKTIKVIIRYILT